MIVAIGTNDTLASPGAQLDYYQSVIDKMGRAQVDRFARLFVMPQTGHGLSGTNYAHERRRQDTRGRAGARTAGIGSRCCSTGSSAASRPGMSITVTAGEKSLPLCSYPAYPKYVSGPAASASSYRCSQP